MKNRLIAHANELKYSVTNPVVLASFAGTIAAAITYHRMMSNGRTLVLCKDAFDALINDETNFVRFTSDKHDHAFRVILEQ